MHAAGARGQAWRGGRATAQETTMKMMRASPIAAILSTGAGDRAYGYTIIILNETIHITLFKLK